MRVAPVLAAAFAVALGALARSASAQRQVPTALSAATADSTAARHSSWAAMAADSDGRSTRASGRGAASLAPRALFATPFSRTENAIVLPDSSPGQREDGRRSAERRRARWAPFASAALPGAGQALLSQQRFLPYLAVEGYALLQLFADRRDGRRQRSAYREIARTVARSQFSSTAPVGDWEYYERMEHFTESGLFDANSGEGLEPEPDTTTYNGSVWLLARQTYWEDPSLPPPAGTPPYESALSFYRQRAVTPEYRWSWRNAELEQDVFRRTIARSNDAYRRAAQDLAVVIANHVLATVDAYVTVRLRSRRSAAGRIPAAGARDDYGVRIELPIPRATPSAR